MSNDLKKSLLLEKRIKYAFLISLCALNGHKLGTSIDSMICTFSFLFLVFLECCYLFNNHLIITKNYIVKYYAIFIGYYFLSIIWSASISDTLSNTSYFVQILCLVIVLSNHMRSPETAKEYLRMIIFSLLYMLVILYFRTPFNELGTERIGLDIGLNQNDLGVRCVVGFFLCCCFVHDTPLFYVSSIILFGVTALLTGSRKSFMMIFLGITIISISQRNFIKLFRNILVSSLLLISVYFIVMNTHFFYDVLGNRIQSLLNFYDFDFGATKYDSIKTSYSIEERALFRRYAYQLFLEHPFFGSGGEGFRTYMRVQTLERETYSHCNYLELLSTLGLVGFCLYYWFEIKVLFRCFKNFLHSSNKEYLFLFTIVFVNLFAEYSYVPYYSPFIQIVLASIALFNETNSKTEVENEKRIVF